MSARIGINSHPFPASNFRGNYLPDPRRDGIVAAAGSGAIAKELERMARRRFQDPKPFVEGHHWYLRVWSNTPGNRKRQRIKLAPASMPEREVKKIAADRLRSVNQGLITAGSAVNFMHFVTDTYEKTALPLLASTVQHSYRSALAKHLESASAILCCAT